MPSHQIEMSINNFFKKTFFRISYISVCSKTFLRLCDCAVTKNVKTIYNLNNSKIPKNN